MQYFPARNGLKQQAAQSHMIHYQVIEGARNLQRESYALLKQGENRFLLRGTASSLIWAIGTTFIAELRDDDLTSPISELAFNAIHGFS